MPDTIAKRLSHKDVAQNFTRVRGAGEFARMAYAARTYQKRHCRVYGRYPYTYLPIAAFKQAAVTCFAPDQAAAVFESSGTTGVACSHHYVRDLALYDRAITAHFAAVFGEGPFTLLVHLPDYAPQSSLVYMARLLMRAYGDSASGFFLDDTAVLRRGIAHAETQHTTLLLFGAAFGLLNLAMTQRWTLPPGARLIETGGMKTHRKSITRAALHQRLAEGFGIARHQVWSEYGMCELLSQAYTRGGTAFYPPPWMQVEVFDPERIETPLPAGQTGLLGVVDLANIHTVSAIMTEDLGVRCAGGFEVLGRLEHSALRGCNFLLKNV